MLTFLGKQRMQIEIFALGVIPQGEIHDKEHCRKYDANITLHL